MDLLYSSEEWLSVPQGSMIETGGSQPWDFSGPADETIGPEASMISNARKIPDAEWELYKDEIKVLYLKENKTRKEVIASMKKAHGFQASNAQYIKKLDKWGFKKYSSKEKWEFISWRLQKRNLEGKESDTFINGELVPRKKLKKEISRHCLPSWQIMCTTEHSAPSPHGIEIHTPPREHNYFVEYLHIPWFEFETLIEPQIIRLRSLAHRQNGTPSLVYEHTAQMSNDFLTFISPSQSITAGDWCQHQPTLFRGQIDDATQGQEYIQRVQESIQSSGNRLEPPELAPAISNDQEARRLFANILGKNVEHDRPDYHSKIISHLDQILIERQEGDIKKNVQRCFSSANLEMALQLLRYSVYLSSNNFLTDHQTDDLLRWIVQSDQFVAIEHVIKLKTATSLIFESNILLSAIRINSHATVEALIALGIDTNIPGGAYPKKTALWQAVETAPSRYMVEERRLSVVRLLLDAGANVYLKSPHNDTSPLHNAIARKDVDLVTTLLNFRTVAVVVASREESELTDARIIDAARVGDSTILKRLLDDEGIIDPLAQPSMITLLQDATRWHDIEDVESLLESGADVHAPASVCYEVVRAKAIRSGSFENLHSAIQIAASRGNLEMVLVLLDAGANVDGYVLTEEEGLNTDIIAARGAAGLSEDFEDDYVDSDGDSNYNEDFFVDILRSTWTPLQLAVARRNGAMARILLRAGANVEGLGRGPTPLQLATSKDDINLVKLILRNGADVNSHPEHRFKERNALQAAVENGNVNMMKLLVDAGAEINAAPSGKNGCTALQAAVQVKSFTLVGRLISLGADVNAAASANGGRTCLQSAAEKGHHKMVRFFLDCGAEVNAAAADRSGLTALQAAAKGGHLSVVKMLLAAGAVVHAPGTEGGLSAVSAAVEGESLEMLHLFLTTGSPDGHADQVPPLLRASRKGATNIVRGLLQAGANINARRTDKPGYRKTCFPRIAIEAALCEGHEDIFRILFDTGAKLEGQPLDLGAALGAANAMMLIKPINVDIFRQLLEAGADVNRRFSNESTPLHQAIRQGRIDLVKMLVDAGADVNSRAWVNIGETPLLTAVRKGMSDVIKILLDAGANIDGGCEGRGGRTALQAAAELGNSSLVRLLLEHGADCNAPPADSHGVTALQAAAINGNLPATLSLLEAGANINALAARIEGRNALEGAAEHGRLDIVSILLRNDPDKDGLETNYENVAKLAEKNGHLLISKILREHKKGP